MGRASAARIRDSADDLVAERGALRAVVHAAGISPTMNDWKAMVAVDLVGSAHVIDSCDVLVDEGAVPGFQQALGI